MKRLLVFLLTLTLILTVACKEKTSDFTSNSDTESGETGIAEGEQLTEKENEEQSQEVPIHPDDIVPTITILEPDSIGNVYMEATYTNNSKYTITGYNMTVLLKDKNEKTYLSNYDTILQGETSPKFSTFGPNTQNHDDYEILTLEVIARTEEGNNLYIDYDFKLGEASWWESES